MTDFAVGTGREQAESAMRHASPGALGFLHERLVFSRRTAVLAAALGQALPADAATALDVGCGDGTIDALLMRHRPGLSITGVDVLVRPATHIPVQMFDGDRLPFADHSFDVVIFVDVLHHTVDPMVLLREARRVARGAVVLKDHTEDGLLAHRTLRFMDWVGNARHNVVLPYNYWPRARWQQAFQDLGYAVSHWNDRLGLYPPPASWWFERKLHFVARLNVPG